MSKQQLGSESILQSSSVIPDKRRSILEHVLLHEMKIDKIPQLAPQATSTIVVAPENPSTISLNPQHGDATARQRLRTHITRGFRRQKATEAQKTSEKAKEKVKGTRKESSKGTQANDRLDAELERNVLEVSIIQPYEATGHAKQELALHPTLGSGRGDPFASLPVDLGSRTHKLLDHCTYIYPFRGKAYYKCRGGFSKRPNISAARHMPCAVPGIITDSA